MWADIKRAAEAIGSGTARARFDALPATVVTAIRKQDATSEILIRAIQLTITLLFALLYAISPKTDAGTDFQLTPFALGIYIAINFFLLIYFLKKSIPEWLVFLSIVIDISLLMILIWSFHVQYGQPPSFYLKVPTFLYIFIFIALRALRFQPRFVLFAGIISSAGWIVMVAYVALYDPSGMVITRDYVEYLTSNSVLIGAEVDKILSVIIVTGVLWLALRRARKLLIDSIAEGAAAQNFSRFFDEPVATRIRSSHASDIGKGRRCDAAVLFIDLRGFTDLAASRDPETVIVLLSEYRAQIGSIIRRHGGAIDKFLGDGIMASFGTVSDGTPYAANALRAVDELLHRVASWREAHGPLSLLSERPLGGAVVAGTVVFGVVGDGDHLEFTVIGSSVNLAAKLEKYNKEIGTLALTTPQTLAVATSQGYRPDRPIEIRRADFFGLNELAVIGS
ncbi:adenylate cyclase [Rhodoligotrophos appendicifer]|uniref:adenylate/guanylate cyclase domain-containing protein n=1 Tax=Rhodoligotrophos appendicifer TaxID=987056 RepID=UPI001184E792|nr:adenylate/guanylate cyclase domain-containing protein [Rhodoligotrophos appendicifer]